MSTVIGASQVTVELGNDKIPALRHKEPLRLKGVLDKYESFDVTPVIGREFTSANLKEWLEAPNADELLQDLAITSEDSGPLL